MAAPLPGQTGLTRRELERELAWLLRRVPDDPRALVRLLADAVVTLIDKNNAALARAGDRDAHAAQPAAQQQGGREG